MVPSVCCSAHSAQQTKRVRKSMCALAGFFLWPSFYPGFHPIRRPLSISLVTGSHAIHLWKHPHRHTQENTILISQAAFNPNKLTIRINYHMINQLISPHPDFTELTPKYHVTFNSNVPPSSLSSLLLPSERTTLA